MRSTFKSYCIFYFFYYITLGVYSPYLNVYYERLGFSGSQIGNINSLGLLFAMFITPLWGVVSDKTYSDMNFMKDITLNKVIERSENNINNGPIGFWIFWTLLTIGAVMGFCSMDNKWLY